MRFQSSPRNFLWPFSRSQSVRCAWVSVRTMYRLVWSAVLSNHLFHHHHVTPFDATKWVQVKDSRKHTIQRYKVDTSMCVYKDTRACSHINQRAHSGTYANICTHRMLWQAFPVKPWSVGRKRRVSLIWDTVPNHNSKSSNITSTQEHSGFSSNFGFMTGFLRLNVAISLTIKVK